MMPNSAKEIIEVIGEEAAKKLFINFGGEAIYIPKNKQSFIESRNQKIKEERLAGVHPIILAKKYHLNIHYVYSIIRKN